MSHSLMGAAGDAAGRLGGSGAWGAVDNGAPAPFVLAKLRVTKGLRVNQKSG
jgi:hypothetical protein